MLWLNAVPALATTGYGVGQESVTASGVANAGGAAAALDASTVYYNPAGMSVLTHDEIMVGAEFILPSIHYTERGSTIFNGAPLSGPADGHGGQLAFVPNVYWVGAVSDRFHLGLGINAPWGLVTEYDRNWIGRYNEITTSLRVANINPSVSYKVSDEFSVGAGFDVQYAKGKLNQAIDFGTVCTAALGPAVCNGAFGLSPQQNDGFGIVHGNTWGYGFNVGLLYQPTSNLRLGAHFRSHVKLNFDGKAAFQVPANARAFLTAAGLPTAFTDTGDHFSLTNPEQASGSIYYKIDPRWAVMTDLTWTRWSRFSQLRITFDNPATPTNTLLTQWTDVYRVAVGTVFDYSDTWTFRGGFAYDESPIPDAFRGPGIPDSDRFVLAAGLSYKATDRLTLDASYQHLFFVGGSTHRPSNTGSLLVGNLDLSVNVIGLGIRWAY